MGKNAWQSTENECGEIDERQRPEGISDLARGETSLYKV